MSAEVNQEALEAAKNKILAAAADVSTLKAEKKDFKAALSALLAAKEEYKVINNGVAWETPKAPVAPKSETPSTTEAAPPAAPREGPSKKELSKLAKKEAKKAGKEGGEAGGEGDSSSAAGGGDKPVIAKPPKAKAPVVEAEEEGDGFPDLEGAVMGEVVTRFPPEPSGYLHIGHAKAVLLNQEYARKYNGKMLVRFDDTNPSKEKGEYEDNIMKDLITLGIRPHAISHSSDHFEKCQELARTMISEGKAYMDDTEQEKMQKERLNHIESYRRNTSPAENLELFEKLLSGDNKEFCLRAKIDMASPNGTMRDPVLYRYNATPHHQTGTRYKAYPTYDFVCPIIDAIEGVTHALRTTEYNDRNEQYHFLQRAMGLRHVYIQTFGKMNFVFTVLSKRRLGWFADNASATSIPVEGWFDPRFPTIQGCVRRGLNVEVLRQFMVSQGASKRVISMEWDKFWAENKKVLEADSARYMGVNTEKKVVVNISNGGEEVTVHSVLLNPLKPDGPNRPIRRFKRVFVDQEDAKMMQVGVDITLLRWGNINPSRIVTDADGTITEVFATWDENATNFKKTVKLTWLAEGPDNINVTVMEYDHLITKAVINEDDNFQDFVNKKSGWSYEVQCDPCLRLVNKGECLQLERKGFFKVDQSFSENSGKIVLIAIPDGKPRKSN